MIEYRQQDLFTTGLPALAHGVNCKGVMGAGIARQFRDRWPDMYETYRGACTAGAVQPGTVFTWQDPETGTTIYNLATQQDTGPHARPWAITAAFGQMILYAQARGVHRVAMPWIGCGIGGLTRVELQICLAPFHGAPVDLIVCEYTPPAGAR